MTRCLLQQQACLWFRFRLNVIFPAIYSGGCRFVSWPVDCYHDWCCMVFLSLSVQMLQYYNKIYHRHFLHTLPSHCVIAVEKTVFKKAREKQPMKQNQSSSAQNLTSPKETHLIAEWVNAVSILHESISSFHSFGREHLLYL